MPIPRHGFDEIERMYKEEGNDNWYIEKLLELITQRGLPLDREKFIENVTFFTQNI